MDVTRTWAVPDDVDVCAYSGWLVVVGPYRPSVLLL